MAHDHNCWRCGSAEAGSLFCRYCNTLQAPTPNYFEFFGLKPALALDTKELQGRFYSLSRLLHPDRYTRRSEQERRYSLEASSILNDAYRVLRDPIERAEYVLKETGIESPGDHGQDVPPELLEEVFELNMALDELKSGDTSVAGELDRMRSNFVEMQGAIDTELSGLFKGHDLAATSDGRRAALLRIRAALHRRRYIRNLVNEVDKQLSARNA